MRFENEKRPVFGVFGPLGNPSHKRSFVRRVSEPIVLIRSMRVELKNWNFSDFVVSHLWPRDNKEFNKGPTGTLEIRCD